MPYRCEAASVEGFVQHLACNLVNKGYWLYVTGHIPERKDPAVVDRKLVDLYGLELSKWARARRKAKGKANVAYLRFGRFFVLLVTQGEHPLFDREAFVRDVRREPIHFHGYCIGCGKGSDGRYHASVKIHPEAFSEMLEFYRSIALQRTASALAKNLSQIRYVPYARIRRQLLRVLREVNDQRRQAGLEAVPTSALRLSRQIVKVFDGDSLADEGFKADPASNIVDHGRVAEMGSNLDPWKSHT